MGNSIIADDLVVRNLTSGSALIESNYINYRLYLNVIFQAHFISLNTFIVNTNLGNLETNSINNIENRLEEINNLTFNNKKIKLKIKNITEDSVKILFDDKSNSSDNTSYTFHSTGNLDYKDIIKIYFTSNKIDLKSIIKNRNLGILPNKKTETIINAIRRANPYLSEEAIENLFINEIKIISFENNYRVLVSALPNSRYITDNYFFLNFNLRDLSAVITNRDLSIIADNRPQTILSEIIRINPNSGLSIDDLNINNITTNSAIITNRNNNYMGNIEINFNPLTVHLNTIIINTNLGEIPDNLFSTIAEAVIKANPNSGLSIDDLVITRVSTNSATVTVRNNNIYGNICVFFIINNKNSNNKRMSNFNNDEDGKDNFKKRKDNFNQQNDINKQLKTTIVQKTNVNYSSSIFKKINLADILINTNLGKVQNNQTETILNKVIKLNNNVEKNNIEIGSVIDNWASIIPASDSKYEGAVMINFMLNKNNYNKYYHIVNKYNSLSKEEKLQKLNEINQHYQNLSENDKKIFKEKLTNFGLAVLSGGALTAYGAKMTVNSSASVTNTEAVEMNRFYQQVHQKV